MGPGSVFSPPTFNKVEKATETSTLSSHQMAVFSRGHPQSPSGSMRSPGYFRFLALLDLVCYSTSGLSSQTSQLVTALLRCEDDGQRAFKGVFAVALDVYLASGSERTHRSTALRDCVRRLRY